VACPEGDAWQSQIRSVGAYSVNGVLTCSGVLVNNTAEDGTPYFLTAAHCGVTQANAQTVVVYWNYQHSTCRTPGSGASGASGDGTLDQFSTGATLRMQDPNGAPIFGSSDVTLLELDDPLDPDFDLYLAGWSRADRAPGAAVAIHHPGVEEKRISFENDPTDIGSYVTTTAGDYDPDGTTHVYVADWDLGTTEGGSSGSPLFDENRRIVGVLSGGFAACGNDRADWYGRLHEAWREAPSVGAPLADWLDPAGTDAVILDGREATSADKTAPAVVDDLRAAGVADTTATLAWTAPGDDGRTGTAQRYDLRLSTAPIPDAVAFAQATPLPAPPVPQPAGGNEAYVVTGLDFDTAYYVALVARDEAGNTSPLSNVASFRTDARPPIVVTSFTAQVEPNARAVALAWQSDGEIGPTQFVVERAEPGALFETLTVVEGRADDSGQAAYSYRLDDVDPNTYRFRVRATRSDGQVAVQEVEAVVPVPDDQPLFTRPIYPNPLQGGAATVTFAAPAPGPVVVQVFDVLGRRVRTLFDQSVAADDTQRVQLSPERLASGVYFVRIRAGGRIETRRLVIVR
jgi:lysyl endopeptidase